MRRCNFATRLSGPAIGPWWRPRRVNVLNHQATELKIALGELMRAPHIATWVATAVAVCATTIFFCNIDYPLGTHFDESTKVKAVLTGEWSHYHPLLMIDIARAINAMARLTEPQSVAMLGRALACLSSGLLLIATWQLGQKFLPDMVAVAAATGVAVLPLTAVHALIFKEDAFVAPWVVFGIAALIGLIDQPTVPRAAILGACIGLAASSKYVGGLILAPFSIAFLLMIRPSGWTRSIKLITTSVLIAAAIFMIVQMPGLLEWRQMINGMSVEWNHLVRGHDVVIPISLTGGLFHLRESLWPGIGTAMLVLGVVGLASPLVAPPQQKIPSATVVAFVLVWYAAHEITPMRPYPGFHRYMLPIGPLIVLNAATLVYYLMCRRSAWAAQITAAAILIAAIPALRLSILIIHAIGSDPRLVTSAVVGRLGQRAVFDRYTSYDYSSNVAPNALTSDEADIVVTSSIRYERFAQYGAVSHQSPNIRMRARYYTELFRLPHLDVASGGPHFSFFNPELKVVALDGNIARLQSIAAALQATMPRLQVHLVK
jgi:hypothetical protein